MTVIDESRADCCLRCQLPFERHLVYHAPVDTPNLFEAPGWQGLYCPPETGRPY